MKREFRRSQRFIFLHKFLVPGINWKRWCSGISSGHELSPTGLWHMPPLSTSVSLSLAALFSMSAFLVFDGARSCACRCQASPPDRVWFIISEFKKATSVPRALGNIHCHQDYDCNCCTDDEGDDKITCRQVACHYYLVYVACHYLLNCLHFLEGLGQTSAGFLPKSSI